MERRSMSWPWSSPQATRQGLRDRLRSRYPAAEIQLRMHEVAFRRLLVRLETADPGRWVVKGGVALLLRLDPNRTSDDIDLTYVDAAGEHATAVEALECAVAVTLDDDDFFSFEIVSPSRPADRGDEDAFEVRVRALIGQTPWLEFGVDLARPAIDVPAEPLEPRTALTGIEAVDQLPPLRALRLPAQVAQKVCAMFEVHGQQGHFSTRARDLVDVAMIAMQCDGIAADELADQLNIEERRRLERGTLTAPLPTSFTLSAEQQDAWRRSWAKATRRAPSASMTRSPSLSTSSIRSSVTPSRAHGSPSGADGREQLHKGWREPGFETRRPLFHPSFCRRFVRGGCVPCLEQVAHSHLLREQAAEALRLARHV
jgi:Nucleotidyl transferase AbiEii toxin, Type IV TA system